MPRKRRGGGSGELSPILLLARPHVKRKMYVRVVEGVAIVRTEDGAEALMPVQEVCRIAERLNLEIVGKVKC